jgi:uncharacterized protein (DUF433 family)
MIPTLEFLDGRITVRPDRCNGKPTIRGLRIAVETVLGLLSAGESFEEILRQYPSLELADIDACLRFSDETRACRAAFRELTTRRADRPSLTEAHLHEAREHGRP